MKLTVYFCFLILIQLHAPMCSDVKKALIFGITGQDGSYLTDFLLEKGYEVHGVVRRASTNNLERLNRVLNDEAKKNRLILHYGDVTDAHNVTSILQLVRPHEIYNLAAQSHVKVSFEKPIYTAMTDALGTLHILEAMRLLDLKDARFYQASTSELFGLVREIPQSESTPFYPRSPYGAAKLYAYWITVNYRESYNLYACNGILFNHESPLRGETFVTRAITMGVSRIEYGLQEVLSVGNLNAKRDWGYAKDYVEAMWLMLQQEKAEDFVIATGQTHTVREFIELAFNEIGITIEWRGQGVDEKGYDTSTGKLLVVVDPILFRPAEVDLLIGEPAYAKKKLGWHAKVTFNELVKIMMNADMALCKNKI